MDISNATIEWIGEIEESKIGKNKVAIDISTNSEPKKRYVVLENMNYAFDLIKNFKANVYKVGDKIDFNFNVPTGNWYPTIWRIINHKSNNK